MLKAEALAAGCEKKGRAADRLAKRHSSPGDARILSREKREREKERRLFESQGSGAADFSELSRSARPPRMDERRGKSSKLVNEKVKCFLQSQRGLVGLHAKDGHSIHSQKSSQNAYVLGQYSSAVPFQKLFCSLAISTEQRTRIPRRYIQTGYFFGQYWFCIEFDLSQCPQGSKLECGLDHFIGYGIFLKIESTKLRTRLA